ncbi:MAG: isopentenyl-diphosphate Delta-isomerase [Ferruginibacter sp.]
MENVILVNERDEAIGSMEKMEAHSNGALHRAFSVFIFNKKGEMLIQQRAVKKYHSGGLWTNACCSHPMPGEDLASAAHRRLMEEMGFDTDINKAFSFTYNTSFSNGLTENEYDHVFTGVYDGEINPVESEVKDYCFMSVDEIKSSIQSHPGKYTEWFKIAFPKLEKYLASTR